MNTNIRVTDEGESRDLEIPAYCDEGGSPATARRLIQYGMMVSEGQLAGYAEHNADVVERAQEEDCFYARISVPFWFRQDDDEVAETFDGDDRINALVEDYSDSAWRIIASETNSGRAGVWFNYEWTFVPKSLATVTRAVGWTSADDAKDAIDVAREIERQIREQDQEEWERAQEQGWEAMLDHVENQ